MKQIMAFGNPTDGGFSTVSGALRAVARLNQQLKGEFGYAFAVSAHWWHELVLAANTPNVGYSSQWNNPRSIELADWMEGVKVGHYAPIGRIIPPGFGIPGADHGMLTNPDEKRQRLGRDMIAYSLMVSKRVKKDHPSNKGNIIFWTGPDGIPWLLIVQGKDILLGHKLNPKLPEYGQIVGGISAGARIARAKGCLDERIFIECKSAGDPCYLDVFTDTVLEIAGIQAINAQVGADVAQWQGELCHTRGGGQTFASAMKQVIKAGVWGGRIHFNAGGMGATSFTKLLSKPEGTPLSMFQQYVDPDFLPGEGPQEWLDDQIRSLEIGARWSADTGLPFEVEFDARFSRYPDTIGALYKSAKWTIETFQRHAQAL